MKKKKRSAKRRAAIVLVMILAIIFVVWFGLYGKTIVSQLRLLNEFHLPATLIFDIEDYSYWNDFLKYTDGYEIMRIDIESEDWKTPDVWNVGETTIFDIVRSYDLGFSSALGEELESGEIPSLCREWFAFEKKPNGNSVGWEFFIGAYDGKNTLFLYRGHHLYGDSDLRITE